MSRLDKLKIFIEIIKTLMVIISGVVLALTTSLIIMIRSHEISTWLFVGIFVDLFLMALFIFLTLVSIQIAKETEDLK